MHAVLAAPSLVIIHTDGGAGLAAFGAVLAGWRVRRSFLCAAAAADVRPHCAVVRRLAVRFPAQVHADAIAHVTDISHVRSHVTMARSSADGGRALCRRAPPPPRAFARGTARGTASRQREWCTSCIQQSREVLKADEPHSGEGRRLARAQPPTETRTRAYQPIWVDMPLTRSRPLNSFPPQAAPGFSLQS